MEAPLNQNRHGQSGVVYVGHIPHGFFEPQMKEFFSQFGKVLRIRISRSKTTANSKGYGFVEFQHHEVAKVVAESMNNYLMFNKILKCELMDPEKVHPDLFRGAGRYFGKSKLSSHSVNKHNQPRSPASEKTRQKKLNLKMKKKFQKLQQIGIDYDIKELIQTTPSASEPMSVSPAPKASKSSDKGKPKSSSKGKSSKRSTKTEVAD